MNTTKQFSFVNVVVAAVFILVFGLYILQIIAANL